MATNHKTHAVLFSVLAIMFVIAVGFLVFSGPSGEARPLSSTESLSTTTGASLNPVQKKASITIPQTENKDIMIFIPSPQSVRTDWLHDERVIPQEAVSACTRKAEGSRCSFNTNDGIVAGLCETVSGGYFGCIPKKK
jgi:hypothetical protein